MKKQTLAGTMLTPMQLQEKAVKVMNRVRGAGLDLKFWAGELNFETSLLVVRDPADKNQIAKAYLSLLNHASRIGVSADDLQILASQRIRIDELKLENETNKTS